MSNIKRVFLITVDCLRGDYVGCIGGGSLTPNIDRLARDSVVFTRAFANGPGTNQSFPAILTSTYFLMHGGMRLLPRYTALAEVLRDHGFKTVGFHSNPFLSKALGWSRGFEEFYDFMGALKGPSAFVTKQQRGLTGKITRFMSKISRANRNVKVQRFLKNIYYKFSGLQLPYLDGEELNKHVVKWVENNADEKFFLWMHYMDPHYPYVPPEKYLPNFSNRREAFEYNLSVDYNNPSMEEVTTLRRLYEGEIRYTDVCIGDFFQFLDGKHLLDDSLILLTGDHGHAFMEHERFGHAYDILYNEVLHVPLIIYGVDNNLKTDSNVQLLDLPPTILDLLGIKSPLTFIGTSMFDNERECLKAIFSESAEPDLINLRYNVDKKAVSCIKGKFKLILNEMKGTKELYDLGKDFREKNNLFENEMEIRKELLSLIDKHLLNDTAYISKVGLRKILRRSNKIFH